MQYRRWLSLLILVSALALTGACGDDGGPEPVDSGSARKLDAAVPGAAAAPGASVFTGASLPDAGDSGAPAVAGPTPVRDLFVISSWITTVDSALTYVKAVPELAADIKLDVKAGAIEVPGYGDAKVLGDKLYVSSGEGATLTSYAISPDGRFSLEKTLDFSMYARSSSIFRMAFVSATVAYLVGDSSWVRWNPSIMAIEPEKSIPFPDRVDARDGIAPYYSFDRGFAVRGKYLFHGISWFDFATYEIAPTSLIAVIDTETSTLETLLDAPCPGLDTATTDEVGNIFYSGWAFAAGAVYLNSGSKACALMIPAGSNTVSSDFKLTFAELTGHEAIGLRYLGDSKFVMQVFDETKRTYNASTDTISDWVYADSWYFAIYDYVTHEYKELKNLGYFGGGYYSERLQDQFFLLTKRESETDYVRLLPDGSAKKGLTVDGWASRVYQLR